MISNTNLFITIAISLIVRLDSAASGSIDYILCRSCGFDLSSSDYIISMSSPSSSVSVNDTLFGKDQVQVQLFSTHEFFHYPIITFAHSTCADVGEWEEETSWFPGYRWKPCVCPECGAYIGFIFEPINSALVWPSKTFYGLILTALVSENLLNTLTRYPGSVSSD